LIFGTALLGIPFHVNVISVEHPKDKLQGIITDFLKEIEELMGIPMDCFPEEAMTIFDDYRGEGWGCPTIQSDRMVFDFPRLEGIFVEKVYTSKTLAGMIDIIKKERIPVGEGACFWHTGGLPSVFAQF